MPDPSDDWQKLWDARVKAFESVLGPAEDTVLHAMIPFQLGGSADVVCFSPPKMGRVYVTCELIGDDGQKKSEMLGNFELMIAHRDSKESWGPNLIARLAAYTHEAKLDPWETMDIGPAAPKGSTIAALLFVPYARFKVLDRKAGLLLCLGITKDELKFKMKNGPEALMKLLKPAGIYPFTDLNRKSVIP